MELRDYLKILREYWIQILVITFLGSLASYGVSMLMTPTYQASAKLFVSVRGDNNEITDLAQGSNLVRQNLSTYAAVVTTESVLEPVVEELGLEMTPEILADQVSANAPADQSLILINVTGMEARQTADIANAVAESLKNVVENELEASAVEGEPSLVSLSTMQSASTPNDPISPNTPINIVLGLLVGLLIGISVAIARTVFDTRIRSAQDVVQITEVPILGGIVDRPNRGQYPLVVHVDPMSPMAESFRTVRTNLHFLAVGDAESGRGRSFVVSSPTPEDDKTTTAINLALSLAETNAKVVLVDADLRLPRIAEHMALNSGFGLSNLLMGETEVSSVLHFWGEHHLAVLPAGKIPPNPSELLGSRSMIELLKWLTENFDYVILDSPPILSVTDSAVLSKLTDGTLLVARVGSTKRQMLSGAIHSLEAAGGQLRGIIVTMPPTKNTVGYAYGRNNKAEKYKSGQGSFILEQPGELQQDHGRTGRRSSQ